MKNVIKIVLLGVLCGKAHSMQVTLQIIKKTLGEFCQKKEFLETGVVLGVGFGSYYLYRVVENYIIALKVADFAAHTKAAEEQGNRFDWRKFLQKKKSKGSSDSQQQSKPEIQ